MQPKPFKPIKTARLSLKPFKPTFKQAQELYDLIDRNRDHLRYLPLAFVKSAEEYYDILKITDNNWKSGTAATYGIYLKGKLIGSCTVKQISFSNGRGEFVYWLDQDYAGNGYITEAVNAMVDVFFGMGLNRLSIRANVKNKASCAVARRCGFSREGICRQEIFNKYTNEYEDVAYYGKLRSQWRKKKH